MSENTAATRRHLSTINAPNREHVPSSLEMMSLPCSLTCFECHFDAAQVFGGVLFCFFVFCPLLGYVAANIFDILATLSVMASRVTFLHNEQEEDAPNM